MVKLFEVEYLREPNVQDTKRLMGMGAVRGFPDMFGLVYCMH